MTINNLIMLNIHIFQIFYFGKKFSQIYDYFINIFTNFHSELIFIYFRIANQENY